MDATYKSEVNQSVPVAKPEEFRAVELGSIRVWPPVVLAPMAGVTNPPFRSLCRHFGAGLYVSEMITARPLVEQNPKTLRLAGFASDETIRSLQLYGVDPYYVGEAVRRLASEGHIDHLDMNFGCPVPKVTRKGGGAAIPYKRPLLRNIVRAAVKSAGHVPVTIKFRMGIDDTHLTYQDAGRIAEGEGCAAVSLHARTAAQLYDGVANWAAIGELKNIVKTIPVLGNGDIWEAYDALRMMRTTGCDGVVVGRGCLGRPWLFRDLANVFEGREPHNPPLFGEVIDTMLEHARLLMGWIGESLAIRTFRKQAAWYTKGFRHGAKLREQLVQAHTYTALEDILSSANRSEPFPPQAMRVARGKTSGSQKVSLPAGYLDNPFDAGLPAEDAEGMFSGG